VTFQACVAVAGGPGSERLADVPTDALVEALRRHRLVAHSERFARQLDPQQVQVLRPLWREAAGRSLAHRAALDVLLPALRDAGVPGTPFKGVVLQQFLRGTPFGRDHVDLDVWVPDGGLKRAIHVSMELGWELSAGLTPDDLQEPLPSELPLHHPTTGLHLDLHQRLFAPHYALDAAEDALRARATVSGFDPVGTALLVGLTGGKDVWNTLRHLADLADLAGRVDLDATAALADRTHTRRILDTGMALAERVLQRPVGWTPRYHTSAALPALEAALRGPRQDGVSLVRLRTWLAARERRRDRWIGLLRLPFTPGALDLREHGRGPLPIRRAARLFRAHVLRDRPQG
jgi:hypothetical protein